MASYRTELACMLPPNEAISAAVYGLVAAGYVVSSTAHARVHLRFEGTFDGGHDADQPHMVTISATGQKLVFAFEAPTDGFFGDAPFSTLGRRELEARARRAASLAQRSPLTHAEAAHQVPAAHHVVVERQVLVTRCKYCGHITPVDLQACQSCGGAKFC